MWESHKKSLSKSVIGDALMMYVKSPMILSFYEFTATRGSDGGGAGMITFTGHYFILFIWACMLFH